MSPLDHLRLWFVGLDSDLQGEIAFALVPALEDNFRGRRFQSERDFIKALEAWLAPTRFAPRTVGKVVSATAFIALRSEERRVGKECRSRWSPYH